MTYDVDMAEKEPCLNRGAVHLRAAIGDMTQAEAAARVHLTQGFFSRLLRGEAKPQSREAALAIQREYGTAPDWWDQPPLQADKLTSTGSAA